MSRIYDNWEKLVEATLNREKLRELAFCESLSSSFASDFSSRLGVDSPDVNEVSGHSKETVLPMVSPIKFIEIKEATRNFHADLVIGEGVFGTVFKGWIHEYSLTTAKPKKVVAIKKWSRHSFQWHEAELNYLSQLHHPNVVKLIGHCSEEDNLISVYEFIPRGSLDIHLFRRRNRSLTWATRIKVAIGAARGLYFLHDREEQIIHGGIQSSNILLDGELNAKLSDFCLAKDGHIGDVTHISTQYIGTHGYAAPEYVATGRLTTKCDVYSFGVVLLDLLAGRRVMDKTKFTNDQNLVNWAKSCLLDKGKLFRIMDSKLEGQYPQKDAYTVAALVLKCLNHNPEQRPKMSEVLDELEKL